MPEDYYKLLGISRKATDDEIKAAYKKLAAESHPDKHPDDPHAEEKFALINGAYRILRDTAKRKAYDAEASGPAAPTTARPGTRPGPGGTGSRPQTGPARPGNNPMSDMFGGMGAGMFGGVPPGAQAGAGTKSAPEAAAPSAAGMPITITIEEAIQGGQVIYKLDARIPCTECRGSGRVTKNMGPTTCPTCSGKGKVRRSEDVPVNIPAGIEEGGKLRVRGKGEMDSRGQRGDLILTVKIAKDGRYELEGRNLLMEASLPYTILTLGGEANVETPAGEKKVSVPAGTQPGARLKLPGMGLPRTRNVETGRRSLRPGQSRDSTDCRGGGTQTAD